MLLLDLRCVKHERPLLASRRISHSAASGAVTVQLAKPQSGGSHSEHTVSRAR